MNNKLIEYKKNIFYDYKIHELLYLRHLSTCMCMTLYVHSRIIAAVSHPIRFFYFSGFVLSVQIKIHKIRTRATK